MEFVAGGELFNYIVANKRIDEKESAWFLNQILDGVEEIHSKFICHRDLKPENLLMNEQHQIKIIDFGLSNSFEFNHLLESSCGSPCYASPEMILGKKYEGPDIDCWSIGIILYAMVCGFLPFEHNDHEKLYKKILKCQLEFPDSLSGDCIDLIVKILSTDPKKRFKINSIRNHPFTVKGRTFKLTKNESEPSDEIKRIAYDKLINLGFTAKDLNEGLNEQNFDFVNTTYKLCIQRIQREGIK